MTMTIGYLPRNQQAVYSISMIFFMIWNPKILFEYDLGATAVLNEQQFPVAQ